MRTAEEIVEQLELRRTCLTHDEGGHCLSCEFNLELADSIEALAKERDELREENKRLRAVLGNSGVPCVYCQLPREEWSKCESGFPGCPRADDSMLCENFGVALERDELREWKRRAVELLAKIQHPKRGSGGPALAKCVCCGRDAYYGCFSDCELAALLREATDAKPTDI